MIITPRLSSITLVLCLIPKIYSMNALLQGASGARIGADLGLSLEKFSKTLSDGFKGGTTFKIDPDTRETLDKLANATVTVSPETFMATSRLTKQAGFIIGGTGIMVSGLHSLISWTNRYFEKTVPATYGDYAIGAISFTALFAGAALIYQSDKLARNQKFVIQQTIKRKRRHSIS